MRAAVLLPVAALLPLMSCRGVTDPLANVSAALVQQSVVRTADGGLDATFRVAITNSTGAAVYYGGCSVSLERQDADLRWGSVWSPACTLVAPANPIEGMKLVPGGGSTETTVRISVSGNEHGWPSEGLEGTYRIRLGILSPETVAFQGMMGVQYRSRSLTTNDFALVTN